MTGWTSLGDVANDLDGGRCMVGSWGKVERSPPHFGCAMGMGEGAAVGIVASLMARAQVHGDNSHDAIQSRGATKMISS